MPEFVWQQKGWTERFRWDSTAILSSLGEVRRRQGELFGKTSQLGFEVNNQLHAAALTEEALTTAAIEGDVLDRAQVRSSVARRLGLPTAGLPRVDRRTDALVEVLLDATRNQALPLTRERLGGWHAALFPTGYSGLHRIKVGDFRTSSEPMQVVSGPVGQEHVHFEAPPARQVADEMRLFLDWLDSEQRPEDGLLRAGIAHFWSVTIHPVEDGNGRVARATGDLVLARDENTGTCFYSLSRQIAKERDGYYSALESTQRGSGDLTPWLAWFLGCLARAMTLALADMEVVLLKARFWASHAGSSLTERQRKVLNRLLDAGPGGFEGGMTTRKYGAIAKASRATAQRELSELVEHGVLRKRPGGGRSTAYDLVW